MSFVGDTGPGAKSYLGDGVYIHHDGYQVWLTVGWEDRIALEPKVLDAMAKWLREVAPEFARGLAKTLTESSHG